MRRELCKKALRFRVQSTLGTQHSSKEVRAEKSLGIPLTASICQ